MKTETQSPPQTNSGKDHRSMGKTNGGSLFPWKIILAPTDLSEPSKYALKTATALAQKCTAKLILLHVVQLPKCCSFDTPPETDEMMDLARKSLDELASTVPADVTVEKIVRFTTREPSTEIVEAADQISANLIVMATHGNSGLKRVLLGSTAETVIHHAPCPVLVVRLGGGNPQRVSSLAKETSNPFRKN